MWQCNFDISSILFHLVHTVIQYSWTDVDFNQKSWLLEHPVLQNSSSLQSLLLPAICYVIFMEIDITRYLFRVAVVVSTLCLWHAAHIAKTWHNLRASNSHIKFRNSEIEFQYRFRNLELVNSDISKSLKFAKFG